MFTLKKTALLLLLSVTLLASGLTAVAQDDATGQALAESVAATDSFAEWLSHYPNYQFNASGPDENGIWYVEFYNEAWDEWLGYANINQDTLEIVDSFVPLPLSPADYQAQLQILQLHVLNDAEVLGWLNDTPDLWDVYPEWNRWDQHWQISFYRGIQGVMVHATVDENEDVYIADILDPNRLEEEEAREEARNSAINLAYTAKNADVALTGFDNWTTYVEQQGEHTWSVSFVSGATQLLFVLVDLQLGVVLQSE